MHLSAAREGKKGEICGCKRFCSSQADLVVASFKLADIELEQIWAHPQGLGHLTHLCGCLHVSCFCYLKGNLLLMLLFVVVKTHIHKWLRGHSIHICISDGK